MVKTARLAWPVVAAVLIASAASAGERVNFEDLLVDAEDRPKTLTEEQRQFEEAKGQFLGFLQSCSDKAYDKAAEQLRQVILLKLSPDVALKLRDLADNRQIIAILADSPDSVRSLFERFLAVAEKGRRRWLKDQRRIEQLVKQLVEGDFDLMWLAVHELATAGQYAAPQLLEKLMDERRREARTRAALALKSCGRSVTLPLAEALLGVNDHVKQDICYILRESPRGKMMIPDQRALPALKAVVQDATVNLASRQEALKTIDMIWAEPIEQLPSAQQCYLAEAYKYYHRDVTVIEPSYEDHIIWSWEGGKLAARVVPEYAYYLEMAEKYCRRALAIDPDYEKVKPLLICVIYAQHHTAAELLAALERAPKPDSVSEQDMTGLRERTKRLEEIINTLPSLGKKHFYAALPLALADQHASVAAACADVLKQLGCGAELVAPAMASKSARSATTTLGSTTARSQR